MRNLSMFSKGYNEERSVLVGMTEVHEVRLDTDLILGIRRMYVDGISVKPKTAVKYLERLRIYEVLVGSHEQHSVRFEIEGETRGSWICRIFVDGKQIREFHDDALKGKKPWEIMLSLLPLSLFCLLLLFLISRLQHR